MTKPKKPPRTKIPRTVRRKFSDGTKHGFVFFEQDAVEQAMQEITVTVQGLEESERMWRALAEATELLERWKEIKADRQRNAEALRRLAELVVLGRVVQAKPGGRAPSDHREAWLNLFDDVRAGRGKAWMRSRICKAIAKDCRDEHGEAVKPATVQRYVARHRPK